MILAEINSGFESALVSTVNLVKTFVTWPSTTSHGRPNPPVKIDRLFSKHPGRPLFTTTEANSSECLITTSQSGADRIFLALGQTLIEAVEGGEGRVKGQKLPSSFLPR